MQKLLAQGMLKQFAGECKQIEKLNETFLKSKFDWNSMSHSKERRNNVRQRMRTNHFLKESCMYMHIILGWAKAICHVEGGHIIPPLLTMTYRIPIKLRLQVSLV